MKCIKIIVILFVIFYLRCCQYYNFPSSISDNYDSEIHWFNTSKNGVFINNFSNENVKVRYLYGYSSNEEDKNMYEAFKDDAYGRLYIELGIRWNISFLFPQRGPKVLWIKFPRKFSEKKERRHFLIKEQEGNYCLFKQERGKKDGVLLGCIHKDEACHFYFNIYDINKTDNSISMSCRDKRKNELFYRW